MGTIQDYIVELQDLLKLLPIVEINEAIQIIHKGRMSQSNVFIMGNGGSASTASHMICDLAKNTRVIRVPDIRVLEPSGNMATLTAYANDEGYDNVFMYHLANFLKPNDIVIAISTSGTSENVIKAVYFSLLKKNVTVIGMTGFNGGKLKGLSHIKIHIPSNCIEQVEDCHLIIGHIFTQQLKELALRETHPAP